MENKGTDTPISKNNKIDKNSMAGNENSIVNDESNLSKDTIAALLDELKKIPTGDDYTIKGGLKTDILKYESMGFGDLLHLGFVDKNQKEYDFNGNISKIELYKDATNPNEENGGYEAIKKYLNKNFRVVWRTLKLKHKPKDEIEMYYEEYDEIIYLKQIN